MVQRYDQARDVTSWATPPLVMDAREYEPITLVARYECPGRSQCRPEKFDLSFHWVWHTTIPNGGVQRYSQARLPIWVDRGKSVFDGPLSFRYELDPNGIDSDGTESTSISAETFATIASARDREVVVGITCSWGSLVPGIVLNCRIKNALSALLARSTSS